MSRKIYIIIAMVFTVVLSVSTFFIIRNHIDSAKQNEVYDNLAEIVEDEPPKENEGVTFSEDKDYLAEYLELYRQNEAMPHAISPASSRRFHIFLFACFASCFFLILYLLMSYALPISLPQG